MESPSTVLASSSPLATLLNQALDQQSRPIFKISNTLVRRGVTCTSRGPISVDKEAFYDLPGFMVLEVGFQSVARL
jgi:hypothetical protein